MNGLLNLYWLNFMVLICFYCYMYTFLGMELNGAKRWINLGFTTLQPSDFTKNFYDFVFRKIF